MKSTTNRAGVKTGALKSFTESVTTMRIPRRFSAWAGGVLVTGLLLPVIVFARSPDDSRSGLPPVVDLGVGGTPAAPTAPREALTDLLQQLESLQTEVRQLRGQLEVQNNEIERLKARQRELLTNIDKRLSELERRGGSSAPEPSEVGPGAAGIGTGAGVVSAQEQKDYDAAFDLMKQGKYDRAAIEFRDYITKYPQSPLRDNAQYWLGEAFYVARDFHKAFEEFAKVVGNNANSPKAPDALLKIGYCYYELGEWTKAKANLDQVIRRYPGTTAAKSAEQRLAKMRKEGR